MAGESKTKPTETGRAPDDEIPYEEKVKNAINGLMTADTQLRVHIQGLENLKKTLRDELIPVAKIVEIEIIEIKDLLRRWGIIKDKAIKTAKEGLMERREKIIDEKFTIYPLYYKHTINLRINIHEGVSMPVTIPDLGIDPNVARAMRAGWRGSDSSLRDIEYKDKHYEYPTITTHHSWQTLSWMSTMPNTEASIYLEGFHVNKNDIKPIWVLTINNFAVEWHSAEEAYREMLELPGNLFTHALLHLVLGDGRSVAQNRLIELTNKNRELLELLKEKIRSEYDIEGTIYPIKKDDLITGWSLIISGPKAQKLAKNFVDTTKKEAPVIKQLYDDMALEIGFEKWGYIIRASVYRSGLLKIPFGGSYWTPNWTQGAIRLHIFSKDIDYVEEIRKRAEMQGIHAIVKKVRRKVAGESYDIWVEWEILKSFLCNQDLRNALIQAAEASIEKCRIWNLSHPDKRKNCDELPQNKWIRQLQDPEWLRSIGCKDA